VNAHDLSTVAVIGAGTMGAGIAGEFARAGCDVRLVDLQPDLLERGMGMVPGSDQVFPVSSDQQASMVPVNWWTTSSMP